LANIAIQTDIASGCKNARFGCRSCQQENEVLKLKIFEPGGIVQHLLDCILATKYILYLYYKNCLGNENVQDQWIGMHFMNPVPIMKLVEIINGYATKKEITQTIVDLSKKIRQSSLCSK